MTGATPEQAAHDAFFTAFGGPDIPDWPPIGPVGSLEAWEAAAQAAIDWQRAEDANPTAEDYDHAAEILKLRDGGALLGKVVVSHTRALYAAWIEAAQHRNLTAATEILAEQLDGFDGPEWNGTETGLGWLERTRGADL